MLKLIGLDYGKSRIGIASGQMITKTATPIATIAAKQGEPEWHELDKIIKQWRPSDIIVGLPIDAKDQETKITEEARAFAQKVELRYQKPVHLISETFSTREARWRLEEVQNKSNRHLKVDAFAACVILETWMNEQS
ncbi:MULTISPECIES: Holliday junction resolvase RuvX [Cysteiniphilum]|uniref:Putative pre-16S rRNA nuclease n=1 Tax=Cysteiniphilum litorale TaxID=2056700 RepID=A0A8J2Z5V0_9GAMM|nr:MULTISPECIES: Holliday junction resolvase RuvX [Cysteiniphilum]GGG02455.1 putative pre-16S rRNA nuclease [Cysteiniphilum litorale]